MKDDRSRYILEPYAGSKSRFDCPQCGSKKSFTKYIDTESNGYLADHVGRCGAENNCGYFFGAFQFINDPSNSEFKPIPLTERPSELSFIDIDIMKRSVKKHRENNLYRYLLSLGFSERKLSIAFELYNVGSTKRGEVCFWYVDKDFRVRTGQIIDYKKDGHRNKESFQSSAPSRMKLNGLYTQCVFGEHRLKFLSDGEPVGLVESPKTALICNLYRYKGVNTWLSYTTQKALTEEKLLPLFKMLSGRKVYIAPDYHFDDRMINGTLRHRKASFITAGGNKIRKFNRNGGFCEDFEPKSKMLGRNGIDFEFLESPLGSFDDTKNDIGDYLTLLEPSSIKHTSECKKCLRSWANSLIDDGICIGCKDIELNGYSKKLIFENELKGNDRLSEIVGIFGLEPCGDIGKHWAVLMPYLAEIDYTSGKTISFESSKAWIERYFSEELELEDFKQMVSSFIDINSSLSVKYNEELKEFYIYFV